MGRTDWTQDARLRSPYRASLVVRYGAVVVVAGAALALGNESSHAWHLKVSFATFYTALIMVSAWLGGLWPGVLSTTLCTLIADYFWSAPTRTFSVDSTSEAISLVLFFFIGVTISLLCEQLHAARRDEQLARMQREETLAIVAHDLKNPLGAIFATLSLLDMQTPLGSEGDNLRARSAVIRRMAARMDYLTRDLLDAAAIEAGVFTLVKAPEHVEKLLVEALEPSIDVAERKGVSLEVEPCSACPRVLCDRARVLQALSNLIGNAVKFTPQGGKVRVRAEPAEGRVRFSVIDTGPGISPENLPNIFDRYWHGRRKAGSETGLGLYIAQGIVQAHGERSIVVTSRPGEGSTFSFTLATIHDAEGPGESTRG